MKKPLLSVLCIAGVISFLFVTKQPANANIYSQYQSVSTVNWRWNPGGTSDYALPDSLSRTPRFVKLKDGVITAENPTGENEFKRSFSTGGSLNDTELDDGYAVVPLGFDYTFNGATYNQIYVSINGFATFGSTAANGTKNPPSAGGFSTKHGQNLFKDIASAPINVLAPFWNDHKYWTTNDTLEANKTPAPAKYRGHKDMTPSSIGYVHYQIEQANPLNPTVLDTIKVCLIQWQNLNVNWFSLIDTTGDGILDTLLNTGNLANFQLIIFEGEDDRLLQGNVQFRYGSVSRSPLHPYAPQSTDWNIGAVGTKGESSMGFEKSDFINALYNAGGPDAIYWPTEVDKQQNSIIDNRQWPPSGDVGRAILLAANPWSGGDTTWGDGDADMSRIDPARTTHYGATETRKFVTISDVIAIMRSVSTGIKLDSAYQQAAFHGDVHHDGRFYFLGNEYSAIHRADNRNNNTEVVAEFILNNATLATPENGYTGSAAIEADVNTWMANQARFSKDTFYLKKFTTSGDGGFSQKWGRNDNFVSIDLRKAILKAGIDRNGYYSYRDATVRYNVDMNNTIRKFRVLNPANEPVDIMNDYMIKIALINPTDADRSLIWALTGDSYHQESLFSYKLKKYVWWRDATLAETIKLPYFDSYEKQLFWEANELDASFILAYLGGKISGLPWIYENVTHNDKDKSNVVPYKLANNIMFDNAEYNNSNIVIPVYYNGAATENQSVSFTFNNNITELKPATADVMVSYDNTNKTAVIISDGSFNPHTPVAYITVDNTTTDFEASNIRFYGEYMENVALKLNNNIAAANANMLAQNQPNPVTTYTDFVINIPTTGNYKLTISDVNGNPVKVIANGTFAAGTVNFNWDITNENGDKVANGTYFYTLEGDNTLLTKSLVIAR